MTEIEILMSALNNNEPAVKFCSDIMYIAHLWDDLIDKDKVRTDEEINQAFEILLLGIPANPFYREYEMSIRPMFHTAIIAWYESNRLQSGDLDNKFYAFFLRNLLLNVVYFSCSIVQGNMAVLHEYFGKNMRSKYEEFLKEGDENA